MDWEKVKTYLIVAFTLLNVMLFWQAYLLPDAVQPPQYLAEPSLSQIEADLATIHLDLAGGLPTTPTHLPLLAVTPRQGNTAQLPDRIKGDAHCPVDDPATAATGGAGAEAADYLLKQGLDYIQSHGGMPDDVGPPQGEAALHGNAMRLLLTQNFPGDRPVFNGYIELCINATGATYYERLLWDPGPVLDEGGTVMPAAVLLGRQARPGSSLAERSASQGGTALTIESGYRVVEFAAAPNRVSLPKGAATPAYVAMPIWRLKLNSGDVLDFDAISGQRVN